MMKVKPWLTQRRRIGIMLAMLLLLVNVCKTGFCENAAEVPGVAELPTDIRAALVDSYVSAYDLRAICFFRPEVWSVLDADGRAYALEKTTKNESAYYGIEPGIGVDVDDMMWEAFGTSQVNGPYLLDCNRSAFGWQPDELYPYITIDRNLLMTLRADEALFVCHKAFYYGYVRSLLQLLDQGNLPERYSRCVDQLERYRVDLKHDDRTLTYTELEKDAIAYGLRGAEYYYGFTVPDDENSLFERQMRALWSDCFNQYYKKDLLNLLADEMSEYYALENVFRIISSDGERVEYPDQDQRMYTFVHMDEELLYEGDPLDCIDLLVQAMLPGIAEKNRAEYQRDIDWTTWEEIVGRTAWERLMGLIEEQEAK